MRCTKTGRDRTSRVAVTILTLLLASAPPLSTAHEVRPGYLELRQTAAETFATLWKIPARGDRRFGIRVAWPANCAPVSEPVESWTGDAYVERATLRCTDGLDGQSIAITGLSATMIDVLVRIARIDGSEQVVRLTPSAPGFVVEAAPSSLDVAATYLRLGIEHILSGADHLLFVMALLLLVGATRQLVTTVTAFTLAHSVTLAAASLGLVRLPSQPVEAVIALSIVFVAAEIVRGYDGRPGIAARRPWLVAFAFGLLHGLGFAGALAEIGLPEHSIPLALLCFNAGVELGQLAFLATVLAATALVTRLPMAWPTWNRLLAPYWIGAVAAYWTIERLTWF